MTGRIVPLLAVAVVVGGGCSTNHADPGFVTVPDTGPTDLLAPSQRSSPTAPPPETPPPCDLDDLAIWTAQVLVVDSTVEAVLRLRNDGAAECEIDLSASPLTSPTMEPDVWLEPGAWADLVVGEGAGCDEDPEVLTSAPLDVNGTAVGVATAVAVGCEPELVAFYPNDVGDEPCSELSVVAVPGAVVLRNDAFEPCRLGSLVSATGFEGVDIELVDGDPPVGLPVLAAGDVVAFDVVAFDVAADGGGERVELGFDSGARVDVQLPGGSLVRIVGGLPRPWIGGPGSPAASDTASLLTALDPF